MPATYTRQPSSPPTLPLNMPGKAPHLPAVRPVPYRGVASSPPQAGSSVATSAVPSLTSDSDYASSNGGSSGVDLVEMLNDRLSLAVDPIPMDRSLAKQAQT